MMEYVSIHGRDVEYEGKYLGILNELPSLIYCTKGYEDVAKEANEMDINEAIINAKRFYTRITLQLNNCPEWITPDKNEGLMNSQIFFRNLMDALKD